MISTNKIFYDDAVCLLVVIHITRGVVKVARSLFFKRYGELLSWMSAEGQNRFFTPGNWD